MAPTPLRASEVNRILGKVDELAARDEEINASVLSQSDPDGTSEVKK